MDVPAAASKLNLYANSLTGVLPTAWSSLHQANRLQCAAQTSYMCHRKQAVQFTLFLVAPTYSVCALCDASFACCSLSCYAHM